MIQGWSLTKIILVIFCLFSSVFTQEIEYFEYEEDIYEYPGEYTDNNDENLTATDDLHPGYICLIMIFVIAIILCAVYFVWKKQHTRYYFLSEKLSKLPLHIEKSPKGYVTPSISIDTESVQSSDESSLRIDTSLKIESNLQIEPKTLSPDLKLPPIKCLDQIDCNKNGDHHPHFVHHIQSNPISNAGIIEQLFIDKRPSK